MGFRPPIRLLASGLLACAIPIASQAQAPAGPIQAAPQAAPGKQAAANAPAQQQKKPPVIHARAELVTTPVTVTDSHGEMVLDLAESDFHVYDNGVEQAIDHFDLGGDPLSIVIVAETSSRVAPLLPAVRKTGIIISQVVMGQASQAAVLGFDDGVSVLQDFTENPDRVEKIINHLPEGSSGARLNDALARAVGMLDNQPADRRRVIVAVAESTDDGSSLKLGQVLRDAQLANVTIYTVGLSTTAAQFRSEQAQTSTPSITPPGTFPEPPMPSTPQTPDTDAQRYGNANLLSLAVWAVQHATSVVRKHPLELASTATGGSHINTFHDASIQKALDNIGGELHSQYVIGYRPPANEAYGYHTIKVTVDRAHVKVRARPGYYLEPPIGQ